MLRLLKWGQRWLCLSGVCDCLAFLKLGGLRCYSR